jgi:NitT/TauT family transport system permease protein
LSGRTGPRRPGGRRCGNRAFFPLFSGVLTAEVGLIWGLFDLYGASPLQRLLRLRLPAALPFMLEGLRVAAGLAVIGAVVAEFVSGSGATQGLAWRLLEAGNRLRTADMLAALACLMVMGLMLNAAVGLLERAAQTGLNLGAERPALAGLSDT